MSKGQKLHLRPRIKGNLWKNMLVYLLTALGSASERDEEFSSALTWVRNVCQHHARAQRTRHIVQTIISLNIKELMAFWVNLEEEKGNREALSLCVDGIKIKRNPMKHNASLYLLTPRVFNCPPCPEAEELGRNWGVFLHLGRQNNAEIIIHPKESLLRDWHFPCSGGSFFFLEVSPHRYISLGPFSTAFAFL